MRKPISQLDAEMMFDGEFASPHVRTYRKKVNTRMIKMSGPFTVETSEGPLHCADGYLAMDARGYPYPIDAREHALIYEEVEDA